MHLYIYNVSQTNLTNTHLSHVERDDSGDVADQTLSDNGVIELDLSGDVGHLNWIVIIVGDVQGVLRKNKYQYLIKWNQN